jgi:hypothetical protein
MTSGSATSTHPTDQQGVPCSAHVLNINGPGMALPPVLVQPAVSPDGTRIAFAETGESRAVWTANADGSHVVRISVPPPSAFDWQPTRWEP